MPSSISSSESEPVFHRRIPEMKWPRVAVLAVVLAAAGVGAWEAYWRVAQQYEASYRNSDSQWAEARRRVDAGEPNATVFIGSSRTQFDIDLDVWQDETGVHGIQLALEGSNALPILTDLANDEDFNGLLVVGLTPPLVFLPGVGLRADAVQRYYDETPSQWLGNKLSYPLERTFAFYTIDTKLFTVLTRQAWWPERPGLPFQQPEVRKIENMRRDRQANLWDRVEDDPEFNAIVTGTWQVILENLPPPPPPEAAVRSCSSGRRPATGSASSRGRRAHATRCGSRSSVWQKPWASTSRTTRSFQTSAHRSGRTSAHTTRDGGRGRSSVSCRSRWRSAESTDRRWDREPTRRR